jgi:hypothetical protein
MHRADEQAEGLALLTRAIKAAGGEEKLAKLQTITWRGKGTSEVNGQQGFTISDAAAQALDKHRLEMEFSLGGIGKRGRYIVNGDKVWVQENDFAAEFPKKGAPIIIGVLRALRLAQLLTPLTDKAYKLSPLGEVKVGDRPAVGIRVTHPEQRELDLFFDKETGLLSKCGMRVPYRLDGQESDLEFWFGDAKEFDGIKHFTTMTVHHDKKKVFVLEVSEVKPQEQLDESLFAKP